MLNKTYFYIPKSFPVWFFCILLSCSIVQANQLNTTNAVRENQATDAARTRLLANCGEQRVFDRNSGRMIAKKRIDLIVTKVELKRDGSGYVSVKPTIKNRCQNSTGKSVTVDMEGATISFTSVAANSSLTYFTWTGIGNYTSIRVTVDSDRKIAESDERNNTCIASFPLRLTSRTYTCR